MRCYCVSGVVLAAAVAFAGYGGAAAASQGGSVMSNSAASPPTAAPLSSATPESPRAIPLGELSSADVVSLLHSWSLDRAFAAGFQEQQFDGLILESLLELDVSSPLALADLQKQFPNTSLLQWIKLKKLVRRVVDDAGGMVDAATLLHSSSSSVASGGGASSESREPRADEASDQRRELAGSSPSLGDGYGGVLVKRSKAIVALGPQGDVAFRRVGNESSLLIEADTVEFTSDHIAFSATEAFVANGTDLVQCCRDNQEAFNLTATEIKFLLAEAQDMRTDIRILKQEMVYLEERLNATCTAADEGAYSCYNVADDFSTCVESIETLELAWTDRTYQFEGAPADLLDTYHTYLKVPLSTSPPCSTEGGFLGTLKKDAQVGICCANHGTYSAAGNKPYASPATYSEGLSNAYGLQWTVHSGTYSLSNHGGTPCTFFETFLEAGDHRVCCSEGWATGIFVSTPEVTCS